MVVPRTCSEWTEENDTQPSEKPLAEYESNAAYVLLGAPGAGKTVAFREESQREGAFYVTARDFITFADRQEWHERTLFIDALDEVRAGSDDRRTPLDRIRAKLDALGRPRFRLSCREADWLGASDRTHLAAALKDGKVRVLRLNPLSRGQARELLAQRRDVDNAEAFIERAEAQGISSLLGNPQDLEMLASAVSSSGEWPQTRQKTFDLACRHLLRENNEEHVIGDATNASEADLLDAAGRLCAVLLLGGYRGVNLRANAEPDHVALREVAGTSQGVLKAALRTGLFVYPPSQIATPAHRHIAEFLSGRYLAGLIRGGLPVGRIMALLTGADGGVVSGLRGLCAWLAALSQRGRLELVERDPIGAVLYGDVREFTSEEKQRLIEALEQHAAKDPRNLLSRQDLDARWGDLATPDVEPIFRQALTDASGDAKQVVAQAVLAALERGNSIPTLRPLLMDVVRNNDCWPVVRSAALRAYVKEHGDDGIGELRRLLDDVNAGAVRDPVDGLRGALLMHLYPRWMTPAEACRYLRSPDVPTISGLGQHFWLHTVVDGSTHEQLGEVLDTLAKDANMVPPERPLCRLPHRLLSRLVDESVDIDARRLFDWLGLVSEAYDGELGSALSDWLTAHPQRYKELVAAAVADQSDVNAMRQAARRIPPCRRPSDFGRWCLSRAVAVASEEAACYYLWRLFGCLGSGQGAEGISSEVVLAQLEAQPSRLKWWRDLLEGHGKAQAHLAQAMAQDEADVQRAAAWQAEKRNRQERWRQRLHRHETEIRTNKCPPALLNDLGHAYFGLFEQAETPAARLLALLGDEGMVGLALAAIRNTPSRTDLPEAAEIVRLALEGRYHHLARPLLAALEERWPVELGTPPFDDDGIRLAMTFHLTAYTGPCWYQSVLRQRPDLAADVLIDSCKIAFRQGKTRVATAIDFDDDVGQAVAKCAVLPLLRMFPRRCERDQLPALRYLLAAAPDSASDSDLAPLVRHKLSLRSMAPAQQLHWLCFGLMLAPQTYIPQVRKLLCGKGGNRHLDIVVALFEDGVLQEQGLDVDALSLLIQALGPHCSASQSASGGIASTSRLATAIVHRLVASLASHSSPAATEALGQLACDEELRHWAADLQHAAKRQADARREAEFSYASVDAVLATLDGLRPANAADLAALTADYLKEMAERIRSGNTSDWRQYWNTPKTGPWEPKDENLCRDALLSDLKILVEPVDVEAVPEGVYTNDGRADIRVSHRDFNVPVEIKKSGSKDLWRAIRGQLIDRYAIDPGARGHGIYLVFWFGRDHCQRDPSGRRPDHATDLEERLRATLTPDQARKITVVVIDVSRPH